MRESCGVVGIYANDEDVARLSFFALFALQHRGQESAGIATADGQKLQVHANMGLVSQVFTEDSLSQLNGHIAIGHNRYSTTGSSRQCNAQPLIVGDGNDSLAIAHNGNIVNSSLLSQELTDMGFSFTSTTDSEVIGDLVISSPERDWVKRIRYAMHRLQGAYSLTMMTKDRLFAARDPFGIRPLSLGKLNGNGWVVASETCALDHIGATFVREIEPGEIVAIGPDGLESYPEPSARHAICSFEYIYFARLDSLIDGRLLYQARREMGAGLAEEHPVDADLVVGVPDSALAAAAGYAQRSGIPLAEGLIKNRYVGRTFIEPDQRLRDLGAQMKYNPMSQLLEGKRIVMVDDSIVRGTTTPHVVRLLRKAGAKEVHVRIVAPAIRYPCFFGVDMATYRELLAARKTVTEIRDFIGADSLGYLSIKRLLEAMGLPPNATCLACFNGEYPIPVQMEMDKLALETTPHTHAAPSPGK